MSNKLYDKLRPATKQRGVGKIAPCPKCGRDAEHYSANYIACERCDAPKPKTGETIEWTLRTIQYKCISCNNVAMHDPLLVAAGERCKCGGWIRRYP